ncbi:MAG: recombinase family protein [Pseudonocardiales bacterium]|nr:recombinase family protein [Pseudonocardiales bacterium]MBV9652151.1 recombinase family protein [Pseudonocardiales bacterium]
MPTTVIADQREHSIRARDYLRVSLDRSGRARSLDEQHADHQRLAAEQGWSLDQASYRDASASASRYARKSRDGFDRLIADLAQDRFGAQVLMVWESSRGSRRVSEWVSLLEWCERRGVRIHVYTHSRTYDPANGRDRRSLLEDAVDGEYESSKISARARRAVAANAVAGRPSGRIPYGYRRVFDPQTRQLIAQEPEPAEAAVVAELFGRLVAGHSLHSIARDFATRGIRNSFRPGVFPAASALAGAVSCLRRAACPPPESWSAQSRAARPGFGERDVPGPMDAAGAPRAVAGGAAAVVRPGTQNLPPRSGQASAVVDRPLWAL